MTRHTHPDNYDSAPACRAKAESLRAIASQTTTAALKAVALELADQWEKRAVRNGKE